jgi:hypothetical protein
MSVPLLFPASDDPDHFHTPGSPGRDAQHPKAPDDPAVVRRAHLKDESYVKAVGIVNYLYSVLFAGAASYYLFLAFQHSAGRISAPWVLRPGWIALITVLWLMAISSGVAAYGLRRLRSWALLVEVLVALCWLIWYFLGFVVPTKQSSLLANIGGTALLIALASPMLNLWDARRSAIFGRDYRRVIAATPSIRASENLPLELWLVAALFLFVALVLICIGVAREGAADRPAQAARIDPSVCDRRLDLDCASFSISPT